jgi:hypothetical protein
MAIMQEARAAFNAHNLSAEIAYSIYRSYCGGTVPPRVPGMDTVIRLAMRIANGATVHEAAAREYVYRWHLAIKAPDQCGATGAISYDPRDRRRDACISIFGTPHLLGV